MPEKFTEWSVKSPYGWMVARFNETTGYGQMQIETYIIKITKVKQKRKLVYRAVVDKTVVGYTTHVMQSTDEDLIELIQHVVTHVFTLLKAYENRQKRYNSLQ